MYYAASPTSSLRGRRKALFSLFLVACLGTAWHSRVLQHTSRSWHSLAAWKAFHSHAPFNCNQLIHYYSYSAFETCHFALLHVEVVFIIGSTLLLSPVEQILGKPECNGGTFRLGCGRANSAAIAIY